MALKGVYFLALFELTLRMRCIMLPMSIGCLKLSLGIGDQFVYSLYYKRLTVACRSGGCCQVYSQQIDISAAATAATGEHSSFQAWHWLFGSVDSHYRYHLNTFTFYNSDMLRSNVVFVVYACYFLTPTSVAGVKRLCAFVCVCVCLSVSMCVCPRSVLFLVVTFVYCCW